MKLDHNKNLPRPIETDEERQARQARNRTMRVQDKAKERGAKTMSRSLVRSYPLCFTGPYMLKKPLKLGIVLDLLKQIPADREADVVEALRRYDNYRSYQMCLVEGAPRVDLDGNPVSFVTAQEANNAQSRIKLLDLKHQIKEQRRQYERDYRLGKSDQGVAAGGITPEPARNSGHGRHRYHDDRVAGDSEGGHNAPGTSSRDRGAAEDAEPIYSLSP